MLLDQAEAACPVSLLEMAVLAAAAVAALVTWLPLQRLVGTVAVAAETNRQVLPEARAHMVAVAEPVACSPAVPLEVRAATADRLPLFLSGVIQVLQGALLVLKGKAVLAAAVF
jgi:hypothetical protein